MNFKVNLKYFLIILPFVCGPLFAQDVSNELVLPDSAGWNVLKEGDTLAFQVTLRDATDHPAIFSMEGERHSGIEFDSLGNFFWVPSYDLVDRVEKQKEITVIFQAAWGEKHRARQSVTFTVEHVNRPPVVEELSIVYVRQSTLNTFQIPSEFVYDPDGDPIVIKAIPSQMPEGAVLSSLGQFTWTPSRAQFYSLRANPIFVKFIVQDQPDKLETYGTLRIQQTQQDLPPEILIVPNDSVANIKEDETLNLKLYVTDPNGDDNVKSVGFIASDTRVPTNSLKENTPLQQEFTWTPGYDFVDETDATEQVEITFFVLDQSNNRGQKKINIKVKDAVNMAEKDAHQYEKYRNTLAAAKLLIDDLDDNQKRLNKDYQSAKKGKKNRSILNASMGVATGISPVTLETNDAQIVSGVGGTTVATLSTLEATEVVGKSKDDIMDKIKVGIEIRNKVQSAGDEFARKYALKKSRRSDDIETDIDKFRATMNDQKLVLLELSAYTRNDAPSRVSNKAIKKTFLDFSEDP